MIFVPIYVSRVGFKGGILGSARQFWGNPYLNSMTVLFDLLLFVFFFLCRYQVDMLHWITFIY